MKLRELELKNFGKFHNRKIPLQDGINVIGGANESGKTTIHTFIRAMLFGMERGRGRASAKDNFSRYEPWEFGNYYSGALRFECDGKEFCLQRNFDKYSKSVDLYCETDGEELSPENGDLEMLLFGLRAASYENTLCIGQRRAVTEQSLAAELKNYATGYYMTGDSDIDVSAAREQLLSKKKDADREARDLLREKDRKREALEQESGHIWRDMHHIDRELSEVELELENREDEPGPVKPEQEPSKWRVNPLEILCVVVLCIGMLWVLPHPWNSLVTVIVILLEIIYVWNRLKVGKHEAEQEDTTDPILEEELIPTAKLRWKREQLVEMRKEKQMEYDNLQESIRELDELGVDYREVDRKRAVLTLAIERLDELSAGMQKQVGKLLDQKVSAIVSELTDGEYDHLTVDESLQMSVWHDSRRISAEQLSQGTLEQIYFALRMAVADLLYVEEYPIILDDTFAFYDDERLERALRWLAESGKQVILFTCHHREEAILEKLRLPWTKITL